MAHNKCRLCRKASGFHLSFFYIYAFTEGPSTDSQVMKDGVGLGQESDVQRSESNSRRLGFKREHDLLRFLLLIQPETDLEFSNRHGHKLTVGNLNIDGFEYWPGKLIY